MARFKFRRSLRFDSLEGRQMLSSVGAGPTDQQQYVLQLINEARTNPAEAAQQVSNNITFTYITNLTRSAQQVVQFEYNINSEYSFQGIRDENGVVSLDLLVRKRKR